METARKYTVLARKYRPKNFDEIIGQGTIVSTLTNILKSKKIGNAYLFCGQRGVGKTTTARVFANAINCENISEGGNPCHSCPGCLNYKNVFELDAASNNSVEDIRNIIDQVRYAPSFGKFNVYIIDEVHMLSQAAFNAFLKTLEEPPAHAVFILATTERNKVLPTIMSRCQIFDFKPVSVVDIVQNLKNILGKENISYEEEALFLIAEKADGAMRDALSFTDSVLNFSPECISREAAYKVLNVVDTQKYFDLVSCLLEKDIFNTILKCNEILAEGYDVVNLAYGLLNFFRNLLLSKDPSTVNFIAGPDNVVLKLKNLGNKIDVDNILTCISEINLWSLNYKDQINKKFSFEFLLFRLKKNIYCERAIIQNTSVGETFVEKNEIKKTFDLNCLNVGEGFSESEENSQKKRSLLDVFEKEIALTNI